MATEKMLSQLFWEPDGMYGRHRIPGVIVTDAGTVIVYNEARTEGSDWSLMDVFMQRSTDGGNTFGEKIYLAEGTLRHKTVNNPVMMQGKDGRLHFLYCRDYSIREEGVFYRWSDDDGLTWSPEIDITYATAKETRNAFALGPGHGICLSDGTLMVPCWMVLKQPPELGWPEDAHSPAVIGFVYSRDNGKTWQMEGPLTEYDGLESPGEMEAVQLEDGRVYLTIRHGIVGYRGCAYSEDGIHFSKPAIDHNIPDPCNFGAVAVVRDAEEGEVLLLVHSNHNADDDRIHMTLRGSTDGGKTWKYVREFDPDHGGYPDMAVGKDGTIYILYEHAYGEKMYWIRTNLAWLKGETK